MNTLNILNCKILNFEKIKKTKYESDKTSAPKYRIVVKDKWDDIHVLTWLRYLGIEELDNKIDFLVKETSKGFVVKDFTIIKKDSINKKWEREAEKMATVDNIDIYAIRYYQQVDKYKYSAIKLFLNNDDITKSILDNSKYCKRYDKDINHHTLIIRQDDLKQELLKVYLLIERLRNK